VAPEYKSASQGCSGRNTYPLRIGVPADDEKQLHERLGHLSREDMAAVEQAIRLQLWL